MRSLSTPAAHAQTSPDSSGIDYRNAARRALHAWTDIEPSEAGDRYKAAKGKP